jgi:putative transposase
MTYRQTAFAPEEWYHCYSRSIDRSIVFTNTSDYERFLQALYLSNSNKSIDRSVFYKHTHADFFEVPRTSPLVAIGAYCLMPNHFHILLQEKADGGISKFMQKLGTSFTMYFNAKNQHVGNVFIKPFRSKHIEDDRYLRRVTQYIHLNPAEIFEPEWKKGVVQNENALEENLTNFKYSSLFDYQSVSGGVASGYRPERKILDPASMSLLQTDEPLSYVLREAAAYYADLPSM